MQSQRSFASDPWAWVLRGAPGVGKSTVARCLKASLPRSAVIEVDALRGMRAAVRWTDRACQELGLREAARLAEAFHAAGDWPVVIVDTCLEGRLDLLVGSLAAEPLIITLWAGDEVLLSRAKHRDGGFGDERVILEMNAAARASVGDSAIDTTSASATEVADAILLRAGMSEDRGEAVS